MRKRQLLYNMISNFISVLVSLSISFILAPYIIRSIGKDAYSFIPISNSFNSFLSILAVAFTSMTTRFVTIKIHEKEISKANDYFSTSFFTNLFVAFFVTIICILVVAFLNQLINIPDDIFSDVRILFIMMFATFILNLATPAFEIAAFSLNRLDLTSIVTVVSQFGRIVVIIVLFSVYKPKVFFIGISIFIAMLITTILNISLSRKILPELEISPRRFKINLAIELFRSSIWNSLNQLSTVLLIGLDLIIANVMLGSSAAGVLAVAKTVPVALAALVTVVPTAFHPYFTILFTKKDKQLFFKEMLFAMKFVAIIVGIPIAGFIALSSVFLHLWVPSIANNKLTILAIISMIPMVASFGMMPLGYIFTITNNIKWPSIVIFSLGIINCVIVIILVNKSNLGIYAIVGVSGILDSLRWFIFVPIYATLCLKENMLVFYPSILKSFEYILILISSYLGMVYIFPISSWIGLVLSAFLMAIFGLIFGVAFMLNKAEKVKLTFSISNALKTMHFL